MGEAGWKMGCSWSLRGGAKLLPGGLKVGQGKVVLGFVVLLVVVRFYGGAFHRSHYWMVVDTILDTAGYFTGYYWKLKKVQNCIGGKIVQ